MKAHERFAGQSLWGRAWFLAPGLALMGCLVRPWPPAPSLPPPSSSQPASQLSVNALPPHACQPPIHHLDLPCSFLSHCRVCVAFGQTCLVLIVLRPRTWLPARRSQAPPNCCANAMHQPCHRPNLSPYTAIARGKLLRATPSPFRTRLYPHQAGIPQASVAHAPCPFSFFFGTTPS